MVDLLKEYSWLTALVSIGVGYYIFWYWRGRRNARNLRQNVPQTPHEVFVRHQLFEANNIPHGYVLAFVRFFEDAYGLKGRSLIAPTMKLSDISSISPDSPMADDIEVSYLLKRLETVDSNAAATLREGTVAEIIPTC